jgi:hypothetical protein
MTPTTSAKVRYHVGRALERVSGGGASSKRAAALRPRALEEGPRKLMLGKPEDFVTWRPSEGPPPIPLDPDAYTRTYTPISAPAPGITPAPESAHGLSSRIRELENELEEMNRERLARLLAEQGPMRARTIRKRKKR